MVPKVGDVVRYRESFIHLHKGKYGETLHSSLAGKCMVVKNVKDIYITLFRALKITLAINEVDTTQIHIRLNGMFTWIDEIVFEPADILVNSKTQHNLCVCDNPEVITTGFNTLILKICKICKKEIQVNES